MTHKTILPAVLAAALVFAPVPAHAEKLTLWQILFPYFTKQPDPAANPVKKGVAPFAADEVATSSASANAAGDPLAELYAPTTELGLDQPHLHQSQIAEWLVNAMSVVLSMNGDDYEAHLKHLATGMDENALVAFQDFVTTNQILEKLRTNNLQMNSFVEELPLLLNQGAVDGRYRWLFEVPVTLTFLPRIENSYEKGNPALNQRVLINIQVGRVPKGQGADGMMIESFSMRKNDRDEKTEN